jgi:hypothetical protein
MKLRPNFLKEQQHKGKMFNQVLDCSLCQHLSDDRIPTLKRRTKNKLTGLFTIAMASPEHWLPPGMATSLSSPRPCGEQGVAWHFLIICFWYSLVNFMARSQDKNTTRSWLIRTVSLSRRRNLLQIKWLARENTLLLMCDFFEKREVPEFHRIHNLEVYVP